MKLTFTHSLVFSVLTFCLPAFLNAQIIVDFEDVGTDLSADSAFRGEDNAGGFTSGGVAFNNSFGTFPGGDFWSGNAYSNQTSWSSGGLMEFAAGNDTVLSENADGSTDVGVDGSPTWGVVFGGSARFSAPDGYGFQSFNFHNTRSTAEIIVNGNLSEGFPTEPFGSESRFGFFVNRIREFVQDNGDIGFEVLASTDLILLTEAGSPKEGWFEYDLTGTPVAGADMISFEFFSTDTNDFGVVTPAYFAVDNIGLVEVVEPLLGDVNLDGTVDFLDIAPFITVLASQDFQLEADIDGNGAVSFLDISPFIVLLSN